ncbi:MAG: radical SAM protein [Clostridia bacterium]
MQNGKKTKPKYIPITCVNALNKVIGPFPYKWDLNIYRGCVHNCKYCYALYSHNYLNSNGFFDEIYIKTNIVEQLEKKLLSRTWKNEVINIGSVTDSYQELEKDTQLMRDILKLMIKYKNPITISTKSDLILRDYDLIDELSEITTVNIAATITTMNSRMQKALEPNAKNSISRFNMLKEFKKTNASIGLHVMPIVPFLTDSYENLNALFYNAKKADVDYVITCIMNLRGPTRKYFFDFIYNNFNSLYADYLKLYERKKISNEYSNKLYKNISELKAKYELNNDPAKFIKTPKKEENTQISFW